MEALILLIILIVFYYLIFVNSNKNSYFKSRAAAPTCAPYPRPMIAQSGMLTLINGKEKSNNDTQTIIKQKVVFDRAFATIPQIIITIAGLNQVEDVTSYRVSASEVKRNEFIARLVVNGRELGGDLKNVEVSWLAVGPPT